MLELLAPAGNLDAVIAAVQNGADAVYMGFGDGFNARRSADNFTRESFAKAVRYCHIRGCKVYVTLNTLVGDREMDAAAARRKPSCMVIPPFWVSMPKKRTKSPHAHFSTAPPRGIIQYYKMESALRSNGTAFPKVSEPRGSQRGQGPLRIRSGVAFSDAFPLRGRWRGGHAATDEVSLDTRRIAENAGKIHRLSISSASRCSAPSRQGEGLGVGQGLST